MKQLLQRLRQKKRGFTLIELIVVLALLAILAAILVPTMLGVLRDARDTVAEANAKTVYTTAHSVYVLNRSRGQEVPASGAEIESGDASDTEGADVNAKFAAQVLAELGNDFDGEFVIYVGDNGIAGVTYTSGQTTGSYGTVPGTTTAE